MTQKLRSLALSLTFIALSFATGYTAPGLLPVQEVAVDLDAPLHTAPEPSRGHGTTLYETEPPAMDSDPIPAWCSRP